MEPLDATDYRRRVLTRLLTEPALADPAAGDPFLVCALPPDATQAEAEARLDEIVAFWNRERNHPRYKGVAAQLVKRRGEYEGVLLDPARRARARERVFGARAETENAILAELDELVSGLKSRHRGAIPRSRVPTLAAMAARRGLGDEAFARWLAAQELVDDAAQSAAPWEAPVRRQIRAALDELASLSGDTEGFRTLYTMLDLAHGAPEPLVRARYEAAMALNAGARHDRRKTLGGELLAHVKNRLLAPGGQEAYQASLRADARDLVTPEVEVRSLLTGEIGPADHESLVALVVGKGWGLGVDDAKDVIREVAASCGASVAVGGGADDLVVCGACHRPQSGTGTDRCRYCAAPLFAQCPACQATVPAASDMCPSCHTSLAGYRRALASLDRAEAAARAGEPVRALDLLTQARAGLGEHLPPPALTRALAKAESAVRAAHHLWAEVDQDVADGRLSTAAAKLRRLVERARDVPSPSGRAAGDLLDEVQTRLAAAGAEVEAAAALPVEEAEAALAAVLARTPDLPEALAALAQLPLAPPHDVVATGSPDGVALTWAPSVAPGIAGYRVVRLVAAEEAEPARQVVGQTAATSFHDTTAPGGVPLQYEVLAADGARASQPARSGTVLVLRDVTAVAAEAASGEPAPGGPAVGGRRGIVLRWNPVPGVGQVVVQRTVDEDAGLRVLPRRIVPEQPGSHVDGDVVAGVEYRYHVFVEYRGVVEGAWLTATPGARASASLAPAPQPVADVWAGVERDGRTKVAFTMPPAGRVRVYATTGARAAPLAPAGSAVDLAELASRDGVRLVGEGQRRVFDPVAVGRVVYTAVTVAGDSAVAGASCEHVAVGRVGDLAARDDGAGVVLTFALPAGVTEAYVRWRHDAYPEGPDDPRSLGGKVTNTKLEIDGGYRIDVPADGRALYAAVYPALRDTPHGPAVPAPTGALVQARAGS